jgi:ParB family chromosome partitioning protein
MTKGRHASKIKMIPIEKINILNPRVRNKKVFSEIKENISKVGLKRPITVTPCKSGASGKEYDLVCGQGRLEAFLAHGQTHIPAMIIEANEEQALIMSLVENCARRKHMPTELLKGIKQLQERGYNAAEIAEKTGLVKDYVGSMLRLMDRGEDRLLSAVESGHMPITVAVKISETPDENMQQALQDIYETKQLRGKRLMVAKQLIEKRRSRGKTFKGGGHSGVRKVSSDAISMKDVLKVYKKEVDRKSLLTKRAEIASRQLMFVTEALRRLLKEDNFNNLLRAEELNTLPKFLSDMIHEKRRAHA